MMRNQIVASANFIVTALGEYKRNYDNDNNKCM